MKVLVAIEDQQFADAIVNFIGTQKWEAGTTFVIMHVLDREPTGEVISEVCCPQAAELLQAEKQAAQDLLLETDLKLMKLVPDANTEQYVVTGRVKEKILEEIEHIKPDLLIVGSHGRTGFTRFLLGSVSTALLSHAPCSVLIVKLPHPAKIQQSNGKLAGASA